MINGPIPEKCNKKIKILHIFFFLVLFLDICVFNWEATFSFVWQSPTYIGNIFE